MGRVVQITTAVATSFEFVLATCLLAVFASAYPDRYRTALWHEGGNKSLNSDPSYRTYLWANYKDVPPMPIVWDERSTQYSLCIAIITMVLWFVRLCIRGRTLDVYGAVMCNMLYDLMLITLWSYSAVIQSSGDYSDPKHIALHPWYLESGCAEAWPNNRAGCRAAKASLGLAVFAALWFGVRCTTTCMYGAYMYGKSSKDADVVNVDIEKRCIWLPCKCT
ncbi:uncharacterized protein M421DRAFT_69642 [Didymella exigua CBS 183.55]|uniref:MARVEL domain-containing protein n=1 Tax=Didymella exigua CBS 183.55 TaxID=1150837 RepID=A0A6A5RE68_9PLEO|nr:uncharacterized protein M421DRAFT_69642 [Didymella exigua CBS 183.55]KAF1925518.1 hypothetical protein M421DRAFT_69642 [Didymella exigua CBS 183.55]